VSAALKSPVFGVDAASALSPQSCKAAGAHFVMRYSSRYLPKALTESEHGRYAALGIHVVSVFEDGATNAQKGYEQGRADALFAQAQMVSAGKPAGRPVYFAVDYDAVPASVDAYFDGCRAVLGNAGTGVYGSSQVVQGQMVRGIRFGWVTIAWSGGNRYDKAQLYQYNVDQKLGGVGVDFNRAYFEDYGQWDYKAVVPKPSPHYERFYPTVWYRGTHYSERGTVIAYDRWRKHGVLNRMRLKPIRAELRILADHLAFEVLYDPKGNLRPVGQRNWNLFDRGWRYKQLIQRAQGARVV